MNLRTLVLIPALHALLQFPAQAAQVTSTIHVLAGSNGNFPGDQVSAAIGPVQDQRSVNSAAESASGRTQTDGISLITLPQHPGLTFVHTAAFVAESEKHGDAGGASVTLAREGRWRFDPLVPELVGVNGSVRFTIQYSWDYDLVTGGQAQTDLSWRGQGLDTHTNALGSNHDESKSDDGSASWTSRLFGISFGNAIDFTWELTARSGSSTNQATPHSTNTSIAELQRAEVFNNSGQLLTRFVDYDWIEVIDGVSYAAASAEMVPEPSSAALLGLGVLFISLRRKFPRV